MVKFNAYNVQFGSEKTRVYYHATRDRDGNRVIFITAKDYGSTALREAFPDKWKNETDSQSDYFVKDHVTLREGDKHFEEVLERCEKNDAAYRLREAKRHERWWKKHFRA